MLEHAHRLQMSPETRSRLLATLGTARLAQGEADLAIIQRAHAANPGHSYALTELADAVLHAQLGTPELKAWEKQAFGGGRRLKHDPTAWGTPAYQESWERTRAAFAASGVYLAADPAAKREDERAGAACFEDDEDDV